MPQNFLYPHRDQPLLLPADMREWLPEDDLAFVVLDAVATLDLGEFRRRYRADGHGRAAFDPEMMVALLLYGYCQGDRTRPGDREAVRAGCRLPGGHRRAAPRSRDHRPVPGPARDGAGRAVQPGAAAAGRRGPGVAGHPQPGRHQAGRQRIAEGEPDTAADWPIT